MLECDGHEVAGEGRSQRLVPDAGIGYAGDLADESVQHEWTQLVRDTAQPFQPCLNVAFSAPFVADRGEELPEADHQAIM